MRSLLAANMSRASTRRGALFKSMMIIALAAGDPDFYPGYPPGLFEKSPVVEPSRPAKERLRHAPTSGRCRHHRDWRYPWPQPC